MRLFSPCLCVWAEPFMAYAVKGLICRMHSRLAACCACYVVAVFANIPILSLLGSAFCGLSVNLMWPGTLSLAAVKFPRGGTTMFGILAIFGDLGGSVGPWFTGLISDLSQRSALVQKWGALRRIGVDQAGLRAGLLAGIIFPVMVFIGVSTLKRRIVEGSGDMSR